MRALMILLALGACARTPTFVPLDVEPLVTVTDGPDIVVHTSSYDLTFGRDGSVRMPVQFKVHGADVLGGAACPGEDRVGIGLDPLAIVSSSVADPAQGSKLDVLEKGVPGEPAVPGVTGGVVVVVKVTYSVPYSCNNGSGQSVVQQLAGESVFTMTANRINRQDVAVTPSTDIIQTSLACNLCGGSMAAPNATSFRSYWRFSANSMFLDRDEQTLGPAPRTSHETCVRAANQKFAVVWQDQQNTTGPELKQDVVAYTWLQRQQPTLSPEPQAAISNVAVADPAAGASDCGELIDDATDETLLFNGYEQEPDDYGIYRFTSTGHSIEIRAPDAALHHAFGVEIPIELLKIDHFRATRDGIDTLFQLQQLGSSGTLVWLYDGVSSSESVTIEFD